MFLIDQGERKLIKRTLLDENDNPIPWDDVVDIRFDLTVGGQALKTYSKANGEVRKEGDDVAFEITQEDSSTLPPIAYNLRVSIDVNDDRFEALMTDIQWEYQFTVIRINIRPDEVFDYSVDSGSIKFAVISQPIPEEIIGITVTPDSIDGIEGDTVQLSIDVEATGGADESYTVTVDDTDIATVDQNDLVTLVSAGTTFITVASVFDPSVTETVGVQVTEQPAVTGITIDPTVIEGEEGTTQQLTISVQTVGGASDDYTTSIDDESVATIDSNDLVSLIEAGSAVITVASVFDPTFTETVNVTVVEPDEVTGITVLPSSIQDMEGETVQLSITVETTGNATSDYTTSVDDENVATIDGNDLVTLVNAGSTFITVTSVFDPSVSETVGVVVEAEPAVTGITVEPTSIEGYEGTTQQLDITVNTIGGADDSYSTSVDNENIATIDGNDLVSLIAEGSTFITITSIEDPTVTETVNVVVAIEPAVTGINVSPTSINDEEGQTVQLTITVDTVGGEDDSYTAVVDDTNIATIDGNDLVTLVTEGSTFITVTSTADPSFTETVDVTVIAAFEPDPEVYSIEVYDQDPDNPEITPQPIAEYGQSQPTTYDISDQETVRLYARVDADGGLDTTAFFESFNSDKLLVTIIDGNTADVSVVQSDPGDKVNVTAESDEDQNIKATIEFHLYEDQEVQDTTSEPNVMETEA